ncbi:MAG: chitobiase/beta-hexosaminidase C-terminal domain-containing protein [Fusobacteriaceae bacterium]|nr:chitobiase/beta-hexosaminidase C-terminal domain-containing protein [Fusobacteriaceae bacterium]
MKRNIYIIVFFALIYIIALTGCDKDDILGELNDPKIEYYVISSTSSAVNTTTSSSTSVGTSTTTVSSTTTSISTTTTENAKISIKGNGKIYYTIDGSDPKIFGSEYSNTFIIESSGLSDSAISTSSSVISSSHNSTSNTTTTVEKTTNKITKQAIIKAYIKRNEGFDYKESNTLTLNLNLINNVVTTSTTVSTSKTN